MIILTLREVAERLRVSEGTVKNLVLSGKLVGFRVNSLLRFEEEALQAYIVASRTGTEPRKAPSSYQPKHVRKPA
jgi:excisionase family DNA binding protein